MSVFCASIFILWVIFATYRGIIYQIKKSSMKHNIEDFDKTIVKEIALDERFYSTPSFDFPNIQLESDMKFTDFCSDYDRMDTELKVTQYCKY